MVFEVYLLYLGILGLLFGFFVFLLFRYISFQLHKLQINKPPSNCFEYFIVSIERLFLLLYGIFILLLITRLLLVVIIFIFIQLFINYQLIVMFFISIITIIILAILGHRIDIILCLEFLVTNDHAAELMMDILSGAQLDHSARFSILIRHTAHSSYLI